VWRGDYIAGWEARNPSSVTRALGRALADYKRGLRWAMSSGGSPVRPEPSL
jgi:hypothetical protein